jgi:hypothetical protein
VKICDSKDEELNKARTQRRGNKAMKPKTSKPQLATRKIFLFHLVSFETYTCGDRKSEKA